MKNLKELDSPLNTNERYLHAINVRLNILIEMFSSFLEVYAKENEVATTEEEYVEVQELIDYSSLTKAELQEKLDSMSIDYTSRMTKAELIELLN